MTLSATGKNYDLDSSYGANHGSEWPATLYVGFSTGDMLAGGTELTNAGGYARASAPNSGATFSAANAGSKTTAGAIQFPISTGAWSNPNPDHFFIADGPGPGANILETGTAGLANPVSSANVVVLIAAGQLTIGF